jgi:predicted amidohydrolase
VKLVAAAIQMPSEPLQVAANLERADGLLRRAHQGGAELAVLPEMFNTGYGLLPDFGPMAEGHDGPTLRLLRDRSRRWNLAIAAGFVEHDGRHLYDALAFCTPEGRVHVYRKRNLVFWERSRFRPGGAPLVVATRWGRIGFAVCADMIYRRVWRDYRGRIDLAVIAAAWPSFADRRTGRPHWLLGRVGPLAGEIPRRVAQDLDIPVIFANQSGATQTVVPVLRSRIADRFAGLSSLCDGRRALPVRAGLDEDVILASVSPSPRGSQSCSSTSHSAHSALFSGSARSSPASSAVGYTGGPVVGGA